MKDLIVHSLKLFLPIFFLLLLGGNYIYSSELNRKLDRLKTEELFSLSQAYNYTKQDIGDLQTEINIIGSCTSLRDAATLEDKMSISRLGNYFLNIAKHKPNYQQIRWLDESGMERVRVDQTKNGPLLVPDSSLQDKSNRYYFLDTKNLSKGKTYYSRFDLNIEHGKIERPFQPMIRIAKPIFDYSGNHKGIVIINYSGKKLLNDFTSFFHNKQFERAMVIDHQGYWLKNPNPEKEWGFMLGNHDRFSHVYPKIWEQMLTLPKGQILTDLGLFTFRTFNANVDTNTKNTLGALYLVSYVPHKNINAILQRSIYEIWGMIAVLVLLSAIGSLLIARNNLQEVAFKKQEALNRQKDFLLDKMIEGVVGLDENGIGIFANHTVELLLGYSNDLITKQPFKNLIINKSTLIDEKEGRFTCSISSLLSDGKDVETQTFLQRADGSLMPVLLMGRATFDKRNYISGAIISFIDLSNEFDSKIKVERLRNFDSLTGLPNQTHALELIDKELQKTDTKHSLMVLSFDINRFSEINRTLGHQAGDSLLKALSIRIKNFLAPNDLFSRTGADQFLICTNNLSASERIKYIETIDNLISAPFNLLEQDYSINAALGVYIAPKDSNTSSHEALHNAELAMAKAKKDHAERIQFYTDDLATASMRATKLEQELLHAIKNNELELYYQPQVDLHNNTLIGAEALIRWKHPTHGFVPPDEFIPLAEQTGAIKAIDNWVLEQAISQRADWMTRYPSNNFKVSINISAAMFGKNELIEKIFHYLKVYGTFPSLIDIELTETSMLKDIELSVDTIISLDALGVGVSMDDFGTGYSSLSYLKNLPIDILKIDKAFIDHLLSNKKDLSIVEAILSIAKGMDLLTIAEGVEVSEQAALLKELGCQVCQGYLYSKPLNVQDFEHWLEQNQRA